MNASSPHRLSPSSTIACVLVASAPAVAQNTARWIGPADAPQSVTTSWWDERNWENLTPPGPGDSAVLGWDPSHNVLPGAYVHFGDFTAIGGNPSVPGSNASLDQLLVQSGNFTFDLNPFNTTGGSPGALSGRYLGVGLDVTSTGSPGNANLRFVNAAPVFEVGGIGSHRGTYGDVTVEPSSSLTFTNHAVIGREGHGVLRAGANVAAPWIHLGEHDGARGELFLSQASLNLSSHLNVGVGGAGSIVVGFGADVVTPWTTIGDQATGNGLMAIIGGSSVTSGGILVGLHGTADLHVGQATSIDAAGLFAVGAGAGSTGTALLDSNATATAGELSVGRDGNGSLSIARGASATTRYANVGAFTNGSGRLDVDGPGAQLIVRDDSPNPHAELSVGREGQGELHITDGGRASARFANAGIFATGNGLITVDGNNSTLAIDEFLVVGSEQGAGRVEASNGASITVGPKGGSLFINPGDSLAVDPLSTATVGMATPRPGALVVGELGQLIGAGTITGDVVNDAGYIGHDSLGRNLTIEGDLRLGPGLLAVAIGDPDGALVVSGAAQLGGTLAIRSINKSDIVAGQEFALLLADSLEGSFDSIDDQTPFGFNLIYRENGAYVVATVPAPGASALLAACATSLTRCTRRRRRAS